MNSPNENVRDLTVKNKFSLSKFLVSWEMILIYILAFINIILMVLKPDLFFAPGTIQSIIRSGMDVSFMALGMMFVLMIGDIDVSVASIMIFSCMVMGIMHESGMPDVLTVLGGITAGTLCGAFNGILVAVLKIPSVIATIGTSMLFRGIVQIVLDVNTLKSFPSWFSALSWQDLGGVIPYSLLCFLAAAAIFAVVLHKRKFGRELYMIGNNATTAQYSGIHVRRVKIAVFSIMGATCALSGILFAGRLGGISSSMGTGNELLVIAIAVFGGISTNGGKGKAYGPIISVFIMAFLSKTLDLLGVHSNIQKVIIGIILLVAVLLPMLKSDMDDKKKKVKNKKKQEKSL